jgi:hypothetical protein
MERINWASQNSQGVVELKKKKQSYWRLRELPRGKRLTSFNVESWIVCDTPKNFC